MELRGSLSGGERSSLKAGDDVPPRLRALRSSADRLDCSIA
jgi:hypothetical protein